MSTLRRVLYPFRLAGARLATGGERLGLIGIGVVAGAAVLAAVLAGRLVMQDRALAEATKKLPPEDHVVSVAWYGAFGGTWRALDKEVAPELERLTGREPVRAMLYRESQIDGRLINLRAADGLSRWVKLRSGRLPRTCVPSHCEVLRIQGKGPIPSKSTLRLIEVGRATIRRDAPFAPYIAPVYREQVARAVRYHTPQPSPVVLADGVDGLSRTSELATFYRSYAWFVPIEGGDVHPWAIGDFQRSVDRLRAAIEVRSDRFAVTAPTEALAEAASSSKAAGRRLLLLGGEGAALLLAFTLLAAVSLRRDVGDARRRLVWHGARRWQVELFTLIEAAATAVAATAVGWAVGAVVAGLVADRAGSPAGDVIRHALLSGSGLATAAAIAITAALLLYAAVRAPALQLGRLALTPLDVAALGAIAVVAVGYARGSVDADKLAAGGGTGTFLLLVPALVTFAIAVIAARLLVPALRALGRLGRRGPVSVRLAATSLARNPGHAAVAATFLVASLGLALFATTYRSTLLKGQKDEAAYAVPAPYVLTEDFSQLIPVRHGAPNVQATQVLRLSGNVPSSAGFTFLGVPSREVAQVGGWRDDFSSTPLPELARRIAAPAGTRLHATQLPAGRRIELPVSVRGNDVGVRAIIRSRLGDETTIALGETHGQRPRLLRARLPFERPSLVGLELDMINSGRLTANAGTGLQPVARGALRLGTLRVDGRPVPGAFSGWIGTGGVNDELAYSLRTDATGTLRPRQDLDGETLPVLATPAVAAAAGDDQTLPLVIEGEDVPARIVGVVDRFPSIVGDAVVADRALAEIALDTRSPGLGTTNELWANRLQNQPATVLLQSRQAVLDDLRSDPLARGALATLAGTALVALALALVGLLLGVVGDLRDERGELFDLEAQGASPATLRTHLRLRALLVAAFGLLGGIVAGVILSALVLSLVTLTASTARPEPPLLLAVDWPLLVAAVAVYAVLACALVGLATRLGGRAPERAAEAVA
jgi:FtsX-like permease family